jgi:hypothetical protein
MNYQDITRVNSEMTMIDLKGKNYAMVPERVTAFRKLYPEGFITTEILSHDGTVVTMQARVGYYAADGSRVILGTGLAQEVKGKGMVNGTSYIENCETSAVGRALGFAGFGSDASIASAEEVTNAIEQQEILKAEENLIAKVKKLVQTTDTDTISFLKAVNHKYKTNYQSIDELRGDSLKYALERIQERADEQEKEKKEKK